LRPRLTTGLPFSLAHTRMRLLATQPTIGVWVASPGLEGEQVAVLLLHAASVGHVTSAAYTCVRRVYVRQGTKHERIARNTKKRRTSENAVKAKFAEFF
jgi:hypothetical protein